MTALFEVNVQGLAATSARRGREHIVYELIANALDQNVTRVDVTILYSARGFSLMRVEDDDPEGFCDLMHAYTLFGRSPKGPDAEKRGRFDLGEKLVIAQCAKANIRTTKGTVEFDVKRNRRTESASSRDRGSVFEGYLRLTRAEAEAMIAAARNVLMTEPKLYVNGELVPPRKSAGTCLETLPTEWWTDGAFHRGPRKTVIDIYDPKGEGGWLYELGIPVVQTGDRYDVNIGQRVPLNIERDNVTPAYLRKVRVAVLETMHADLKPEDAASPWVGQALEAPEVEIAAVRSVVAAKHGNQVAINDPSAPETRYGAVNLGYEVISGRQYNKAQWENLRRLELPSTADVAPGKHESKVPDHELSEDELTPAMKAARELVVDLGRELLGYEVSVRFISDPQVFAAMWGGRQLTFNVAKLTNRWFEDEPLAGVIDLLIHEFGHTASNNHLDAKYHAALTKLAGDCVMTAIQRPRIFIRFQERRKP